MPSDKKNCCVPGCSEAGDDTAGAPDIPRREVKLPWQPTPASSNETEKKERSRSRSPIIMKLKEELKEEKEDVESNRTENIVNYEQVPNTLPNYNIDNQIIKLEQSMKDYDIEILDSDDDVDQLSQNANVKNATVRNKIEFQKNEDKCCTILYVKNLPRFYVVRKYKNIIIQAIGNAAKYSQFFYVPKDNKNMGIGEILIQCANPVDCDIVYRCLRTNLGPPIKVIKDNGHKIAKKLNYKQRKSKQFKLNSNVHHEVKSTVLLKKVQQYYVHDPNAQDYQQNPNAALVKEDSQSANPICITPDDLPCTQPVYIKPEAPVNDTFGLNLEFLNKIGVHPPLRTRVIVQNMIPQITEEKIREVFSLAGTVRSIKLTAEQPAALRHAVVEFDHPVEAVQAISMLDGHKLYNRVMKVTMDSFDHPKPLPLGLESIGPGLGPKGQPLRGVHTAVAIKPIKDALQHMPICPLNPHGIQSTCSTNVASNAQNNPTNHSAVANFLSVLNQPNILHGINSALSGQGDNASFSNLRTVSNQNMQAKPNMWHNTPNPDPCMILAQFIRQNMQSMVLDMQNMQQQMPDMVLSMPNLGQSITNMVHDMTNVGQSTPNFNQFPDETPKDRHNQIDRATRARSDMLVFSNLPDSVNTEALNTKMREVGKVLFGEMTGPGRAIVRFQNPSDAERCIKLFNHSKVDGQVIHVKYF